MNLFKLQNSHNKKKLMVTFFESDEEKNLEYLNIYIFESYETNGHTSYIFSPFYFKKIKHITFYLDSIKKKIVLIKWSNTRETLILTPNTLEKK